MTKTVKELHIIYRIEGGISDQTFTYENYSFDDWFKQNVHHVDGVISVKEVYIKSEKEFDPSEIDSYNEKIVDYHEKRNLDKIEQKYKELEDD